jgi:hypothetical protein
MPPEEMPPEGMPEDPNSIGARLREFARNAQPQFDPEAEAIGSNVPAGY